MVWDLRNARAPEKILTGHEKGVLSLSWCKQDADLLLSCGKDNRALCWNPQTSEVIGELPSANNWAFQVDWCPRNPDMLATAFFDGTIGIHSIQSTNEAAADSKAPSHRADGSDLFDAPAYARAAGQGTLSLQQPPKWLRRPVSSSFGFGGKLVTVSNLESAQGKPQSSVVHLRSVVTENELIERANAFLAAVGGDSLQEFAEKKNDSRPAVGGEGWKALLSLFKANSRNELVTLLGFSKEEVAARVAEAIENLKTKGTLDGDITLKDKPHESVVSFAEPESQEVPSDRSDTGDEAVDDSAAPVPSDDFPPDEDSAGLTSDAVGQEDQESATTAPSLFGDDGPGTPQHDFFNTVGVAQDDGETQAIHIPHTNYGIDSSVAATIGSGPSSVTSEVTRGNGFKIYSSDESDIDRLVTKALVLGDFESAVSLCLSSDRFADAILLAVRGGPELLQRTQKAYFERRTTSLPYLRLLQSIVGNDLTDIVQNADLDEWREIFVVICTFASDEDFPVLAEQLGSRLDYRYTVTHGSDDPETELEAHAFRKNAILTYLASARLEKLISIWTDELAEEETALTSDESQQNASYYTVHAHALQTFIEKVTVFRAATKYRDDALETTSSGLASSYKLSVLYDRYFEYAELLSAQGLLAEAVKFLKLVPTSYKGSSPNADLESERKRLVTATTTGPVASTSKVAPVAAARVPAYNYVQPAVVPQPAAHLSYEAPSAINNPYAPVGIPSQPAQAAYPTATPSYSTNYPHQQSMTHPPHLRGQPAPAPSSFAPPPRAGSGSVTSAAPPPKRDNGGWNDAPSIAPPQKAPAALNLNKPAAITSPFPNSPGFSPQGSPYVGAGSAALPPPPRPGSVNRGGPPATGHRAPSIAGSNLPPPPRPGSTAQPPNHMMSPPQAQGVQRQPTPSQYAPPPSRGPIPGQTPPPSQFNRPMGPGQATMPPPPQQVPGPYAPPVQQHAPGPYAPPPGAHQSQHMGGQQPPPPPPGPYAPQGMQQQVQRPGSQPPPAGNPPPPGGPGGPPRAPSQAGAPPKPVARPQPAAPKYRQYHNALLNAGLETN